MMYTLSIKTGEYVVKKNDKLWEATCKKILGVVAGLSYKRSSFCLLFRFFFVFWVANSHNAVVFKKYG